jgi:hypothetical protein
MDSGGKCTVRTFFRLRPTEGTIAPIRYPRPEDCCLALSFPPNPQIKRCTSARVPIPPAGLAVRAGGGQRDRAAAAKLPLGAARRLRAVPRSQLQHRGASEARRRPSPCRGTVPDLIWEMPASGALSPWPRGHPRARAHARSARRDADAGGLRLRCP